MKLHTLVILFLLAACSSEPAPSGETQQRTTRLAPEAAPVTEDTAPTIAIKLSSPNLLFRYFKDGKINLTTSLEKVPKDQLHAVYIDNLDISPMDRQSVRFLQRYDISSMDMNREYQGTPVLRADVENQIRKQRPKPEPKAKAQTKAPEGAKSAKVVLYSTTWCGYCRKARNFLSSKKIPFVEKDIEKSPAANQEMKAKAAKAGVRVGGVPVLDVNGKIIPGFDPNAILQALDG